MNRFAEKPELKEFESPADWVCPITGIRVPKDPAKNLQWRLKVLELCEDPEIAADLYTACSQSLLFFVNAFVFTLRVFETREGKVVQAANQHVPYVTWPIQDRHLLRIEQALDNGEELLTDKSRDMGATWDHLVSLVHRLLFRGNESHLVISRKEDAVDVLDGPPKNYPFGSLSDPGTLFGKIDYILSRLPEWMVPSLARKKLHLSNRDNGARIDGESSNATAGSSDRRTSIFLDEFAKVDEAEAIKRSTKDVTACRLVCSTPNGAGTTFSKWRNSGTIEVFVLPWWEHPEKGANRYTKQNELGQWQIRSPWYDQQEKERSPKELAIEVDMDHIGSGDTFFEASVIEQHRRLFARKPRYEMTIGFLKKYADLDIVRGTMTRNLEMLDLKTGDGPWKIWCELERKRPDQTQTYTIGIDISKGQGASNSVMSILCNETKEKIAEFADANTPPFELARLAVAASIWVGGRNRPLVIWENNGDPGFDFGYQFVKTYRYPNVYFARQSGTLREKRGKRYGWRSSPENKASALGILRRAYSHGKFRNPCNESLTECLSYIYYDSGGIGPAELVVESDSARKTHGDRVIADMLCLVGSGDGTSKSVGDELNVEGSFAKRLQAFKTAKKVRSRTAKTFHFEAA